MISWNGLRLEKGETGLIDNFHSWFFFTSAEMPIIMIRRLSLKQQFFTIGGIGKSYNMFNTFRSHPNFKTKSRKVMLVYTRYPAPRKLT